MGCHHGPVGEFRVVVTAVDYDRTVAWFTDVMGLEVLRSFEKHGIQIPYPQREVRMIGGA